MNPANNPLLHPLKGIPSGMDHDPHADEEVIDQTSPRPSSDETELRPASGLIPSAVHPDPAQDNDLSTKIAYALEGTAPLGEPVPHNQTHLDTTPEEL